ncbi:ribosomal protein S6 kinase alpha-2 isoform X1 [Sigmodon hispidus]
MPIAQLLELWKKIEVEPMEIETTEEELNLDAEPTAEDATEELLCFLRTCYPARQLGPALVLGTVTVSQLHRWTKAAGLS